MPVALPLKMKPVPVSNASVAAPGAADLAWPHMVPSAQDATQLLFEPARLPHSLHEVTLKLLKDFDAEGVSAPPPDVSLDAWLRAQAVTWRLCAAAALAQDALKHDEAALQQMFEEAAGIREWLLEQGTPEALALRVLLQKAWGDVLAHAPTAPVEAPQRPPAKTGNTRIGPMPARPERRAPRAPEPPAAKRKTGPIAQFDDLDAKLPIGRYALFAVLILLVLGRAFFVEHDLKAPPMPVVAHGEAP